MKRTPMEIATRLRSACTQLRRTPMALSDLIPQLQEAANALDEWTERERRLVDIIHGICPACGGEDLHSALINGRDGISCCECPWGISYAQLRSDAPEGERA